jgi:hypothetical protein
MAPLLGLMSMRTSREQEKAFFEAATSAEEMASISVSRLIPFSRSR